MMNVEELFRFPRGYRIPCFPVTEKWSDNFFNWGFLTEEACQGDSEAILKCAQEFVTSSLDCPFNPEQLTDDFLKRL